MALNYDGRAELRFFYATTLGGRTIQHKHTIDILPEQIVGATPPINFVALDMLNHAGGDIVLAQLVDDYLALMLPLWRPSTEFLYVELWRYNPEPSEDATFMGVYNLADVGSAASGVDVEGQQATLTFRTASGGVMRVQYMEPNNAQNNRETYPTSLSTYNAIITYMTGTTHAFVARDNSRPIGSIAVGFGRNERLMRKRFRE
jgi:hypothetical protein